jgi:prepilin-type N-terminal cleavage/methylation domain-containing protein
MEPITTWINDRLGHGAEAGARAARSERGTTLLELLVTLTILAILLVIAVPSYLSYESRARVATAKSNLREAIPAVEAYYHDHATYEASLMTIEALRTYDQGLAPGISVVSGSDITYCLKSTLDGVSYYKNGTGAQVTTAACS